MYQLQLWSIENSFALSSIYADPALEVGVAHSSARIGQHDARNRGRQDDACGVQSERVRGGASVTSCSPICKRSRNARSHDALGLVLLDIRWFDVAGAMERSENLSATGQRGASRGATETHLESQTAAPRSREGRVRGSLLDIA